MCIFSQDYFPTHSRVKLYCTNVMTIYCSHKLVITSFLYMLARDLPEPLPYTLSLIFLQNIEQSNFLLIMLEGLIRFTTSHKSNDFLVSNCYIYIDF